MGEISKKLFFTINERKFNYDGHQVKYLLKKGRAKVLCVVFSAFPKKGEMPKYNLVKNLWGYDCSFLYICDDFVNIPTGGSYYLGNNGDYWGIEAVSELIIHVKNFLNVDRLIGIGTSKAGTAALMFGLRLHFDSLIIGACQYRIGSYMNCDYHRRSLQMLVGHDDISNEEIEQLNNFVLDSVRKNNQIAKTTIYFQYSENDHTYSEQMEDLLYDLRSLHYNLYEKIEDYSDHNEVAKFFPPFLKEKLAVVLNSDK